MSELQTLESIIAGKPEWATHVDYSGFYLKSGKSGFMDTDDSDWDYSYANHSNVQSLADIQKQIDQLKKIESLELDLKEQYNNSEDKYIKFEDTIDSLEKQLASAKKEIEGLKADKDSWRRVAWSLELEKLSLREQLDAWSEKYADLKIESDANKWAHDNMQEQLANAKAEAFNISNEDISDYLWTHNNIKIYSNSLIPFLHNFCLHFKIKNTKQLEGKG